MRTRTPQKCKLNKVRFALLLCFALLYILCDLLCLDPPSMPIIPMLVPLWIQRPPMPLLVRTLNFRV